MSEMKNSLIEIRDVARATIAAEPYGVAFTGGLYARERIDPQWLAEEGVLSASAHPQYRYESPYTRTQIFLEEYNALYPSKQFQLLGRRGRPIEKTALPLWSAREYSGFWRARQHADAMGMPYREYIRAAMDHAIEHGHRQLPAPNQLYTEGVREGVERAAQELRRSGRWDVLGRTPHLHYLIENFRGDPLQVAARDLVAEEIMRTGAARRPSELRHYMRELRVIDEADARVRFGDEVVDAALSERLLNSVRPHEPVEGEFYPGCLGMVTSSPGAQCIQCPYLMDCQRMRDEIDQALIQKHGTTDVLGAKRRADNLERKQRQRERKRSGAKFTLQEQRRLLREAGNPKLRDKRLGAERRRQEKQVPRAVVGESEG